jgi:hypothetical protein
MTATGWLELGILDAWCSLPNYAITVVAEHQIFLNTLTIYLE